MQNVENKQEPRSRTKIICTAHAVAAEMKKPSNHFKILPQFTQDLMFQKKQSHWQNVIAYPSSPPNQGERRPGPLNFHRRSEA